MLSMRFIRLIFSINPIIPSKLCQSYPRSAILTGTLVETQESSHESVAVHKGERYEIGNGASGQDKKKALEAWGSTIVVMIVALCWAWLVTRREEMMDRADRHALRDSAIEVSFCHHGTLGLNFEFYYTRFRS